VHYLINLPSLDHSLWTLLGYGAFQSSDVIVIVRERIQLTTNSCAAKYKIRDVLRDDRGLFDRLSRAVVRTTDAMSTILVLPLPTETVTVQSDRSFIYHEVLEGRLVIYVPRDPRKRRACYRTQLPQLLTEILCVDASATWSISTIISSSVRDLE
jgi:hypothetical protein